MMPQHNRVIDLLDALSQEPTAQPVIASHPTRGLSCGRGTMSAPRSLCSSFWMLHLLSALKVNTVHSAPDLSRKCFAFDTYCRFTGRKSTC